MSKMVSFKEKEKDLYKFVEDKDFSYYVKSLIRADMNKTKQETPKPKKRNINFQF